MSLSKFQETVKNREAQCAAVHGAEESDRTERLKNKSLSTSEEIASFFFF